MIGTLLRKDEGSNSIAVFLDLGLESDLHLSMKDAIMHHHAQNCISEKESTYGKPGETLRVDVRINRNDRRFLFECETMPNLKRLKDKGRRRNLIRYRNVYILVVTEAWYHRLDWGQLRGYFDIILAYNVDSGSFTHRRDLRKLGPQCDSLLDVLVPIYYAKRTQDAMWYVKRRINRVRYSTTAFRQCTCCKLGLPTPWHCCPMDTYCKNSTPCST